MTTPVASPWRERVADMLHRLKTMQPPNVVLQQITMLGEARDLLREALASPAGEGASSVAQGDADEAAMEAWHSAVDDAGELFTNAPDQRYASRASRVLTWIKANRPTPPPAPAAEQGDGLRLPTLDGFRGLHPETLALVRRFAYALACKLSAAEQKYGYSNGWMSDDWMDECRAKLVEHVGKGDPRDVAAYCAFLWHHDERTALPQPEARGVEGMVLVPSHYAENVGYAAATLEQSECVIDRHNAPPLRTLAKLLTATPNPVRAEQPEGQGEQECNRDCDCVGPCKMQKLRPAAPGAAVGWFADVRRCLEDVSTEMRSRGRGDERFQRLIQRMPAALAGKERA